MLFLNTSTLTPQYQSVLEQYLLEKSFEAGIRLLKETCIVQEAAEAAPTITDQTNTAPHHPAHQKGQSLLLKNFQVGSGERGSLIFELCVVLDR